MVSFTPQPLYLRGKSPRYPLDRGLGGPQIRSGRFGEEKILDPTGTFLSITRLAFSYQSVLYCLMVCICNLGVHVISCIRKSSTSIIAVVESKVNTGEVLVMGGVGYNVFMDGRVECLHIRSLLQFREKG
jgi:hypothetical protein